MYIALILRAVMPRVDDGGQGRDTEILVYDKEVRVVESS
jgi:hypothetical protein